MWISDLSKLFYSTHTFQLNCTKVLHFSAFHLVSIIITVIIIKENVP